MPIARHWLSAVPAALPGRMRSAAGWWQRWGTLTGTPGPTWPWPIMAATTFRCDITAPHQSLARLFSRHRPARIRFAREYSSAVGNGHRWKAPYSYTWAAPAGITLSATSTSAVSASVGAGVSGLQTFTITVAPLGGSPFSTSLVSVTVNAPPANPRLVSNGTLTCAKTSVTLTACATGGSYSRLNDGKTNTTGEFVVSTAGNYTVTIANAEGCSGYGHCHR